MYRRGLHEWKKKTRTKSTRSSHSFWISRAREIYIRSKFVVFSFTTLHPKAARLSRKFSSSHKRREHQSDLCRSPFFWPFYFLSSSSSSFSEVIYESCICWGVTQPAIDHTPAFRDWRLLRAKERDATATTTPTWRTVTVKLSLSSLLFSPAGFFIAVAVADEEE